jgi:hypothetical protein
MRATASPIQGFPNYVVDTFGRVARVKNGEPVPIKPFATPDGYLRVALYSSSGHSERYVHRLVLETHGSPPPMHPSQVRHLNGRPDDNRLENLAWGTAAENARDRVRHGTSRKGIANHNAKLSNSKVKEIRRLAARGWTQENLSRKFEVGISTIQKVLAHKTWTHV